MIAVVDAGIATGTPDAAKVHRPTEMTARTGPAASRSARRTDCGSPQDAGGDRLPEPRFPEPRSPSPSPFCDVRFEKFQTTCAISVRDASARAAPSAFGSPPHARWSAHAHATSAPADFGASTRENVSGWDGDDARALGVEDGDRGVGGTRADLAVGTRGGSGVAGPGGVWGYRADALDVESSARVAAYHRARRAVSGQRHERRGVGTTRARDGGPVQRDDRGGVDRGSVRAEGHDDARVAREGLAVVGDGRHLDAGGGDVRQRAE